MTTGWQPQGGITQRNHFFTEGSNKSLCEKAHRRIHEGVSHEPAAGHKCVGCLSRWYMLPEDRKGLAPRAPMPYDVATEGVLVDA